MATNPPTISFLVPCFNYARYLRECVDSIRKQTFGDFELLILDDASTDETPHLARALETEDPRIHYIRREKNIGHLQNYNDGIRRANGELIWLISADDCLSSPDIAARYVEQFRKNPSLGLAFCRVQCIDEESRPYDKYIPRAEYPSLPGDPTVFRGHDFYRTLLKENFVASPSALARKACYEENGYFHLALTHSGDWYNWLVFALDRDVYYDPEPAVFYRKHAANMHATYEKPRHAHENTLLCYTELEAHLKKKGYPRKLLWWTTLARLQYKKKHGFALSVPEKVMRVYGKLTRK